jgi:hypothetical protein
MGTESSFAEEIVQSKRRYSYVGVAGKSNIYERGLNSGINEKGLAAAITYVGAYAGLDKGEQLSTALQHKLPRGIIIEDIVGNASTLLEAVEIAQWHLNRDIHVGGNIVIADETGIVSIEELERRFALEFIGDDFFFRSNHFLNLTHQAGEDDSRERLTAIRRAFNGISPESADLSHIKEALSYRGSDAKIYKKKEDGLQILTISTVIYDIRKRIAHYRYTIDSESVFQELRPL